MLEYSLTSVENYKRIISGKEKENINIQEDEQLTLF
jgi:hypothetical protein